MLYRVKLFLYGVIQSASHLAKLKCQTVSRLYFAKPSQVRVDYEVYFLDSEINSLFSSISRVMTLKEHMRWVVKVHLQRGTEGKIVTAR